MCEHTTKIRLCEQSLASHRAKLSTAANKDQIRRAIAAVTARLAGYVKEHEGCTR